MVLALLLPGFSDFLLAEDRGLRVHKPATRLLVHGGEQPLAVCGLEKIQDDLFLVLQHSIQLSARQKIHQAKGTNGMGVMAPLGAGWGRGICK